MKKLKLFLLPLALIFFVASCTKEGPEGPAGNNGTNGINGLDGNANVIVVNHGADSMTTVKEIIIGLGSVVTSAELDSSLVLVYYLGASSQSCSNWYASPGLGCGSAYQTRWYYSSGSTTLLMSLRDADGTPYTGSVVRVDKVKVVIAKGNSFFSGKRETDFSDYNQVKVYFNLKD